MKWITFLLFCQSLFEEKRQRRQTVYLIDQTNDLKLPIDQSLLKLLK